MPDTKTNPPSEYVTDPAVEAIMKATRDIVEGMREAEN